MAIYFEMTWNRRTTAQQTVNERKRDYPNRRKMPVQQIPHHMDRFNPLEEYDDEAGIFDCFFTLERTRSLTS